MDKTDEELNLAEAMAKRYGVRMCDEDGDAHGEELYCVGIDDIADIIREATDLMDMLRLIETIKYLRGIAERGLGREIREDETIEQFVLGYVKQLESTQPVKQEPVARPFECWSTNDGDSWFEHPADAQLIYDVLGDDPKVGDEFEVSAGWNCVTATYQIASKDGDDFEVKCVSHPNNDTAPVSAKAIRAEALEEAAKMCFSHGVKHESGTAFGLTAAIRGLK